MHYLELVSSVDPRGGGVIAGITALTRSRAAAGDRTTVVSLDDSRAFNADAFPFTWIGLGPGWGRYGYAPAFRRWLDRHASDYDAVIVNGLWQYHGQAAWRSLTRQGIPYLVFPHGMLDPWFARHYPLKHLKKKLFWHFEHRLLRDAAAVCFTCERERVAARDVFRPYQVRESVVGYGIDDPPAADPAQLAAFMRMVPAAAGKRIILFLSRLHEKKGCDLLIKAFAEVRAHDTGYHLVMAGPDQEGKQATLQALAAELGIAAQVSWPGMLSGDAKWGAYRSAEAFCLPSHSENFGVVVAEALACDCPVLISDQVNIQDEVTAGNAGLVAPDTVAGTAEMLRRWIADGAAAGRMRARARPTFIERFHIGAASARIRALIPPGAGAIASAGMPVGAGLDPAPVQG
jgi:glycosyltransferase involved in cell wall biosynthesis